LCRAGIAIRFVTTEASDLAVEISAPISHPSAVGNSQRRLLGEAKLTRRTQTIVGLTMDGTLTRLKFSLASTPAAGAIELTSLSPDDS
jgi:hypothetical protein